MMDITKLREEFEEKFPMPKHVIRCGSGYAVTSYGAWAANSYLDLWEGWKAGRESIEVELPEMLPDEGYSDGAMFNFCRNDSVKKCAEALRTAGIRIKGESE
ncbi:hypothetical protein [Yersinia massiliensis]|uniref:hypothetical protein n=1 Tax=Yersinia massiliensis TaxID=419257 RepID=UPI0025AE60A1|nr:hypothetical protein [Yersinia massiliensis]